jgi:hypothetical protein
VGLKVGALEPWLVLLLLFLNTSAQKLSKVLLRMICSNDVTGGKEGWKKLGVPTGWSRPCRPPC